MLMNTMGDRIRTLRKNAGLTQKQLGSTIGVSSVAVTQWEANAQLPKGDNADKLCSALKSDWQWLRYGKKAIDIIKTQRPDNATSYESTTDSYLNIPLYDEKNLSLKLQDKTHEVLGNISSIAIGPDMYSDKIFALSMERSGLKPMINQGDRVFIKPESPIKSGALSMFLLNGEPLLGRIDISPTNMSLSFEQDKDNPGWQAITVTKQDYIGRLIAIDPIWAIEQRKL